MNARNSDGWRAVMVVLGEATVAIVVGFVVGVLLGLYAYAPLVPAGLLGSSAGVVAWWWRDHATLSK